MLTDDQHFCKFLAIDIELFLCILQIAIPLRRCLYDFLQSGVEKLLVWAGIELSISDLRSQSGEYNHSALKTLSAHKMR